MRPSRFRESAPPLRDVHVITVAIVVAVMIALLFHLPAGRSRVRLSVNDTIYLRDNPPGR